MSQRRILLAKSANKVSLRVLLSALGRTFLLVSLLLPMLQLQQPPVHAIDYAWTAYNDCAGTTGGNTTAFTVTSGNTTGLLKDYATGTNTSVRVTFTSSGSLTVVGTAQGAYPDSGTDAHNTFYNKANMVGVMQYGSSGYWVDMTFTDLDPAKTYTFAASANRDGSTYTERISRFTLSGDEAATNASTPGVSVIDDHAVAFSTGYNTVNGYVARWTGIQPGSDGSFVVRVQEQTAGNQGYGPGVFMLAEEAPTGPTYTLTANNDGNGMVTLSPPGGTYVENTVVTLTPAPDTGYEFSEWSGPAVLDLTDNGDGSWSIIMDADKSVTANFVVSLCSTVNLVTTGDTRMRASQATTNYGSEVTVTMSPYSSSAQGGLFKWDVSSIPPDAIVSDASLSFYVTDSSAVAFSLYHLRREWGESTATWRTYDGSNDWGTAGAANTSTDRYDTNLWDATATTFGDAGSVTIDLNASGIAVVQDWIDGDLPNYGLTIQNYGGSNQDYWIVASKEAADEAQWPRLNVTYCTAPAGPTITTSTGSLAPFSTAPGMPSAPQTYTVSGTSLTTDIDITAPEGFEISTDGTNYSSNLALSQSGGSVSATTIYARLTGAAQGTFNGDIAHTSTDATTQNVTVSGEVSTEICFEKSFVAVADTYMSGYNTTNNYGAQTYMRATLSTSNARGSLVRWDLSEIPPYATVTGASLKLHVSTAASQTFYLYNMRQAWVEGTGSGSATGDGATWQTYDGSNAWGTSGAANTTSDRYDTNLWDAGSSTFSTTGSKTVNLNADGLAAVQGWIADSSTNHGLTIQNYGSSSTSYDLQLSTKDNATEANRPYLIVNYCVAAGTTYILSAVNDGHGTVTLSPPGGTYVPDTVVTLTPVPDTGYEFSSWTGTNADEIVETGGVYTIVMDGHKSVIANFGLIPVNEAPNQPTLVQPLDGATDVSTPPTLEVTVTDPEEDPMTVSFYGRIPGDGDGEDFTLFVYPDTQMAAASYPEVFNLMSNYVVSQKAEFNVVFATHVGDIVNVASNTTQWERADTAMGILGTGGIPYSVGPGNHDMGSLYNTYFGPNRFSGNGYYQGSYASGQNENNYSFFSASGMDFIIINLQYGSTTAHYDWADALLKAHPDRRGIVVKHDILNVNNSWNNQAPYTALADNPNLFLILCGHMHSSSDGSAYRAETRTDMQTVHVLLTDYQDYPNGGNGYLRNLRFSPGEDKIYATIYSPYLEAYLTSETNYEQFAMDYDMDGSDPFTLIGSTPGIASGSNASIAWPDLADGTEYEWYVEVSDGRESTTGPVWDFTTAPFAQSCYPLTLSHTGEGDDPVASPIQSPGCSTGHYVAGETIDLSEASPAIGWGIASWTGTADDESTASTNNLTMPPSAHSAAVDYLRILGDVNLDGDVNSNDALIILTCDAGLDASEYCPMNCGDVNDDGKVSSTDALIILTHDVGLEVPYPVGQPGCPASVTPCSGCNGGSLGLNTWFRPLALDACSDQMAGTAPAPMSDPGIAGLWAHTGTGLAVAGWPGSSNVMVGVEQSWRPWQWFVN